MAATKKTSTTKKKNTPKKNTGTKKATMKQETIPVTVESDFIKDVILWLVLAVSVLLFISNLGIGGIIGNTVSGFFFGVFGLISYLFPICLLVGTFFTVSNKTNKLAMIKIISAAIFVVFLCMLVELIVHGASTIGAVRAFQYGKEHQSGGGWIGGLLAGLCNKGFGLIGAYVIDVVALIITLVLITEKSTWRGLQKGNARAREKSKARADSRAKAHELERMQRQQRIAQQMEQQKLAAKNGKGKPRRERKIEGIAEDTTIVPEMGKEAQPSDEVNEIKVNIFDEDVEVLDTNRIPLKATKETAVSKPLSQQVNIHSSYLDEPGEKSTPKPSTVDTGKIPPQKAQPESITEASVPPQQELEKHATRRKTVKSAAETAMESQQVASMIAQQSQNEAEEKKAQYLFPPISLLHKVEKKANGNTKSYLMETADKLQQTLKNFGVDVSVTDVSCGPAVTRYEIQPEMGVKVSKIVNLADDIKLNLAASDIRIEAPIPGKAAVGIEVPNKENVMVSFRELMESNEFKANKSHIAFAAGRDIAGQVVVSDIAKMPHLLIAGATGSGKSVCINTIIMSILYKANPEDVKFIMIDPKVVELSVYNGIPHLLIPVVTDPKKAAGALHWAVNEMTDRYNRFAQAGVRDMKGYNQKIVNGKMKMAVNGEMIEVATAKMPQIVIIVDELADLMMVAAGDVEEAICRLAQLARAAGIHLVIATQRPSVNVITGLIKANMPSRIAFSVTSGVDSRTILDMVGAEKLLGKGDMLYYPQGFTKPLRVQGAFVSDDDVQKVVSFLTEHNEVAEYDSAIEEKMKSIESTGTAIGSSGDSGDERDLYFEDAGRLIIDKEKGSIGMLQRNFKIGFNRAARIMDQLEEAGVVGPEEGTKPRRVLMSIDAFEELV